MMERDVRTMCGSFPQDGKDFQVEQQPHTVAPLPPSTPPHSLLVPFSSFLPLRFGPRSLASSLSMLVQALLT